MALKALSQLRKDAGFISHHLWNSYGKRFPFADVEKKVENIERLIVDIEDALHAKEKQE